MSDTEIIEEQYDMDYESEDEYEYALEGADIYTDGFKANERASGVEDVEWRHYQTNIHHDKDVIKFVYVSPEDKFKNDVIEILKYNPDISLTDEDKNIIVRQFDKINWITFKIPITFVLGYMIFIGNGTRESVQSAFQILKNHSDTHVQIFELVKYYRYWKFILKPKLNIVNAIN